MENDSTKKTDNPNYEAYKKLGDEVPFKGPSSTTTEQSTSGEFMNFDEFSKLVSNITKHPAFSFEEAGQPKEYSEEMIEELYGAIGELKKRVDSEHLDLEIPDRLETILAEDEQSYPFNDNYEDKTARTAHGLLCGKGGNCIGFSEVCCMILSMYGYKPTPVLSRLNKTGAACHYVTCFKNKNGEVEILDPERKRSCDEPEKLYSLTAYQGSLRYAVPTRDFSKVKMSGEKGIGPAFDDYFEDKKEQVVIPIELLMSKLDRESDEIEMYEKEAKQTRINLKADSMSFHKKELLDKVISETLGPVYRQSLAFMSGEDE